MPRAINKVNKKVDEAGFRKLPAGQLRIAHRSVDRMIRAPLSANGYKLLLAITDETLGWGKRTVSQPLGFWEYRTGIPRNHIPNLLQKLVELGFIQWERGIKSLDATAAVNGTITLLDFTEPLPISGVVTTPQNGSGEIENHSQKREWTTPKIGTGTTPQNGSGTTPKNGSIKKHSSNQALSQGPGEREFSELEQRTAPVLAALQLEWQKRRGAMMPGSDCNDLRPKLAERMADASPDEIRNAWRLFLDDSKVQVKTLANFLDAMFADFIGRAQTSQKPAPVIAPEVERRPPGAGPGWTEYAATFRRLLNHRPVEDLSNAGAAEIQQLENLHASLGAEKFRELVERTLRATGKAKRVFAILAVAKTEGPQPIGAVLTIGGAAS